MYMADHEFPLTHTIVKAFVWSGLVAWFHGFVNEYYDLIYDLMIWNT